jgi:hypothetical protein
VGTSGLIATDLVAEAESTASAKPHKHITRSVQLSNMSRHAPIVEEFDDDTDLPLPSQSLPDTGSRSAILEEIVDTDDDNDDGDGEDSDEAPELLDHSAIGGPALQPSARDRVTDITPYKKCANRLISNLIRHSLLIPHT